MTFYTPRHPRVTGAFPSRRVTVERKRIKLALQGGGAYGAYTAGAVIALLQDPKIEIVEISGTSAGEKIALIVGDRINRADSYDAGRKDAIAALLEFWALITKESAPAMRVLDMADRAINPARWNPFLGPLFNTAAKSPNIPALRLMSYTHKLFPQGASNAVATDSLRSIIRKMVTTAPDPRDEDDRVITHAASGKFVHVHINTAMETDTCLVNRVHTGGDLTIKRSMGSSALIGFFEPSIIEGEKHWDGGYTANPSITPLLESNIACDAILIIGTNRPIEAHIIPRLQSDIPRDTLAKTDGLILHQMYAEAVFHAQKWKPGQPSLHLLTYNHGTQEDWTAKQNTHDWHIQQMISQGQNACVNELARIRPYMGMHTTISHATLQAGRSAATAEHHLVA